MKLIMTGTGTPFMDPNRHGPGQIVEVGGEYLQFDCGDSSASQIRKAGVALESIKHLFLTHLHTDHTHGLSQFIIGGWILGRRELHMYGAGRIHHLMEHLWKAYEDDLESRLTVREPAGLMDIDIQQVDTGLVVETDKFKVTAAPAKHVLDSHGFRVDGDKGSVVITGDTSYTPSLVELSRGAHTLVHECFLGERDLPGPLEKITQLHSTPELAARTAAEAGVQRLVLTHVTKDIDPEDMVARAHTVFDGEVVVAEDLQEFDCAF